MAGPRELAAALENELQDGDFSKVQAMMQTWATDDFVQEWPQSGERLTKANSLRLDENYSKLSGTSPTFTYKRMLGGGDVFVVEGTIDYGDGIPVSYVGVVELQDGQLVKSNAYFGNPFEAPAWRAEYVDKMEPVAV